MLRQHLDVLRSEFSPLAQRAAMLYSVLRSLSSIHPSYLFTQVYLVSLYDEAVQGKLPEDFACYTDPEEVSSTLCYSNNPFHVGKL